MRIFYFSLFLFVFGLLGSFLIWPEMDLAASSVFFDKDQGFTLGRNPALLALNDLAVYGSRWLGAGLLAACVWAWRRGDCGGLKPKALIFLFLGLIIGPGLIANVTFKDHWGRARPRDIEAFGGHATFSPPLVIASACDKNCSFVAGDGAFGFYLPILAYVVAPSRRRKVFGLTLAVGSVFAIARIVMGAHFLSDVLYAAFFMFVSNAFLHSLFYGPKETLSFWKDLIKLK